MQFQGLWPAGQAQLQVEQLRMHQLCHWSAQLRVWQVQQDVRFLLLPMQFLPTRTHTAHPRVGCLQAFQLCDGAWNESFHVPG